MADPVIRYAISPISHLFIGTRKQTGGWVAAPSSKYFADNVKLLTLCVEFATLGTWKRGWGGGSGEVFECSHAELFKTPA